MNCTKCKNPINNDSQECEWCGHIINKNINNFSEEEEKLNILNPENKIPFNTSKKSSNSKAGFLIFGIILITFISILVLNKKSSKNFENNHSNIKDTINSPVIWMAENLNVDKFRNGENIPQAKTKKEWIKLGESGKPAWCYYDNDPKNGSFYGKLYNWYAVNDERGIAPEGWHVPSRREWELYIEFLGGESNAFGKMKSDIGWVGYAEVEAYTNESNSIKSIGFDGRPGGWRGKYGTFDFINIKGCWWSTDSNSANAWFLELSDTRDTETGKISAAFLDSINKGTGWSVRCCKN
jgi:uncharacterized protein (TIGR02145 family)